MQPSATCVPASSHTVAITPLPANIRITRVQNPIYRQGPAGEFYLAILNDPSALSDDVPLYARLGGAAGDVYVPVDRREPLPPVTLYSRVTRDGRPHLINSNYTV